MNVKVDERIKQQIHELSAMGLDNVAIALRFNIAPKTVAKHLNPAYRYKQPRKVYYFISPEGVEHKVENILKFSIKHELSEGCLSHLVTGARKHHKQWTFSRVETLEEL